MLLPAARRSLVPRDLISAVMGMPLGMGKTKKRRAPGRAPAENQTRVSSVAGTYTITVLPALRERPMVCRAPWSRREACKMGPTKQPAPPNPKHCPPPHTHLSANFTGAPTFSLLPSSARVLGHFPCDAYAAINYAVRYLVKKPGTGSQHSVCNEPAPP